MPGIVGYCGMTRRLPGDIHSFYPLFPGFALFRPMQCSDDATPSKCQAPVPVQNKCDALQRLLLCAKWPASSLPLCVGLWRQLLWRSMMTLTTYGLWPSLLFFTCLWDAVRDIGVVSTALLLICARFRLCRSIFACLPSCPSTKWDWTFALGNWLRISMSSAASLPAISSDVVSVDGAAPWSFCIVEKQRWDTPLKHRWNFGSCPDGHRWAQQFYFCSLVRRRRQETLQKAQ